MVALDRPHTRWVVVATLWATLGITSGLFFSFPVFFVPLIEEFGWSRGVAAGAFSLSSVVQGLLSPLVGMLVDRFGPRRVMLGGSLLVGVSAFLGSQVASLWHLYVVIGVLGAAGICAVGWVPGGALITQWFAERRGSVMGIAFSGMGVGILVMGPLTQWLIATQGWRRAYMLLGVGSVIVLLPMIWAGVREAARPARRSAAATAASAALPAEGISVHDAMRTRAFWALFFAYMCTPLAVFPVVTHQVAFAVDQGFPRLFVASIFGLTGLMSVGGRVLFGVAADRIGRAPSATMSYACTALGTLALLSLERWHHAASLYVYALLFGLGFGARGPIITAMASQLFPGRRFAAIYGAITVGNGAGGAVGPWFAGAIHDMTGSYRIAFLLSVFFCAMGATCFWIASYAPRPEKKDM